MQKTMSNETECRKLWKEGVINVMARINKVDGLVWFVFNPDADMFAYLQAKYQMWAYRPINGVFKIEKATSILGCTHLRIDNKKVSLFY